MDEHTSIIHLSVTKTVDALSTYVFDVFQILNVSHFSLDKLKDDAIRNERSSLTLDPNHEWRTLTPDA